MAYNSKKYKCILESVSVLAHMYLNLIGSEKKQLVHL